MNERIINEVIRLKKVMTSLIEEFQAIVERNNLKSKCLRWCRDFGFSKDLNFKLICIFFFV